MNIDKDLFRIETNHVVPAQGNVLISEPFLCDQFFGRSVILVVEHSVGSGTMGLMLNKPMPLFLSDILSGFDANGDIPVYRGGPLSMDRLFYLHTLAHVQGALNIVDDLFLNGDFDAIRDYIVQGNPVKGKLRFFLGYSGWGEGQLREEVLDNTWMVGHGGCACVMDDNVPRLWENELSKLGDKYRLWSHFPQIPTFN